MGIWSKLARLWRSPEAPGESELKPGEAPFAQGPARAGAERNRAAEDVVELRREMNRLSEQLAKAQELTRQAEQERQALLQEGDDHARENAELRAALEKQQDELQRVSGELEKARRADAQTLEEMLAEVERERGLFQDKEKAQVVVQGQLEAELKEALTQNTKLQSEAEKLRAELAHGDSELLRINAERQRLLNEYGQQCMELIGLQKVAEEKERLKEEMARLREELEEARSSAAGGPARGPKKPPEPAAELARRDEELRRLQERISSLEKELASRGSALPLAGLPPPLQQVFAHMGSSADAQRIVTELWERLMEQESRYNAAREDTNRRMAELENLRRQLAELYGNIITPITVLSATADLLAMRKDMPKGAQASLEEMKQLMATVRQAISRMQKITTTGRDKE